MQFHIAACIVAGILAFSCTLQSVASETDEKLKNIEETLKMLQDLDKYYSQIAKPSTRSGNVPDLKFLSDIQEAVHKVRLRELDRKYLQRTRPRFGKRNDYAQYQDQILDGEDYLLPERNLWDHLVR